MRKTIVNVVRPDGSHHKLVFVRYYLEGAPEHSIQLKPHGSAKSGCAIPYLRTYRSKDVKDGDCCLWKREVIEESCTANRRRCWWT